MRTTTSYLDPVAFGRWASERRRELGWPSQRALADAAESDSLTQGSGITESFLARLEAGVLVWPPRGDVRRRVIELAWFFCETPGAVTSYLRLAGCTQLGDEERALVARITDDVTAARAEVPLLLPPRPRHLIGREPQVDALLQLLLTRSGGCCAVTGMVGVGKSALAAETVHRVACDRRQRAHYFPDGVICLSMVHRHGLPGLLAVLDELCAVFLPAVDASQLRSLARPAKPRLLPRQSTLNVAVPGATIDMKREQAPHPYQSTGPEALADAINRTRMVLAGKRLLLLFDDLDPGFPLAAALEALLPGGSAQGEQGDMHQGQHVTVLVTSRTRPDPALVTSHLHVLPLDEISSLALLAALIGRPLGEDEQASAAALCAALGNLPLAIEQAASAVRIEGIPIELLMGLVARHPLDPSWRGGAVLRERFADAMAALPPEARSTLALLPLLGSRTFALSTAASLKAGDVLTKPPQTDLADPQAKPQRVSSPRPIEPKAQDGIADQPVTGSQQNVLAESPLPPWDGEGPNSGETVYWHDDGPDGERVSPLAQTAALLGQLVRNSLLELIPRSESVAESLDAAAASSRRLPAWRVSPRYEVSPLLHAWAVEELRAVEPTRRERAYQNLQAYIRDLVELLPSTERELADEWPSVWATFAVSRRRGDDQQVLAVANALARSTPTLLRFQEQAGAILDAGVAAGRRTNNRLALSRLLSRSGIFYYYRGSSILARQVWDESAEIAESMPMSCGLFAPHYNMAVSLIQTGEYETAHKYIERFLRSAESFGHSGDLAYAYSARAETFRLQGAIDRALSDLSTAGRLLTATRPTDTSHTLMVLHLQLEQARVLGRYDTATALADELVRLWGPSLSGAQIALDQAEYAAQYGIIDDARRYALQVARLGRTLRSGFFIARARALLDQLREDAG